MIMKFKLGSVLRDKITGFEGVSIARCEYLTGCDQYCLKPKIDKDGKMQKAEWFDVEVLDPVEGSVDVKVNYRPTGGPQSDAPAL